MLSLPCSSSSPSAFPPPKAHSDSLDPLASVAHSSQRTSTSSRFALTQESERGGGGGGGRGQVLRGFPVALSPQRRSCKNPNARDTIAIKAVLPPKAGIRTYDPCGQHTMQTGACQKLISTLELKGPCRSIRMAESHGTYRRSRRANLILSSGW
eukprot:2867444-Rhodomonas_salina.1